MNTTTALKQYCFACRPTEPKHTEVVQTPQGEIVRPPPAGTRDDTDIVPASDLG